MERKELLDQGYLEEIEYWGSDERIIEAARMSTDKGFLGWACWKCVLCGKELDQKQPHTSEPAVFCHNETEFDRVPRDEKLLAYLWSHKHATPFEMAGLVIEVQAPIMVFREWHRHRIQSIVEGGLDMPEMSFNEMSARYVPLPDVNYIPTVERLMLNSKTNKQAGTIKGSTELTEDAAMRVQFNLQSMYEQQEAMYQQHLAWGVPKELARVHLPVGRYSKMRASANLRNWLAFLTLRMDPAAQWEIRQYATAVGEIIAERFPRTWALFVEGRVEK